jgi:hypothetical protein
VGLIMQKAMIDAWNRKWTPGIMVAVGTHGHRGRTLTVAEMIDGEPKIYVDGLFGAVPLKDVRPAGQLYRSPRRGRPESARNSAGGARNA